MERQLDGIPEHVIALARSVAARSGQLWIVGGWVRDRCAERRPKDLDLVCFGLNEAALDPLLRARGAVQVVGRAFPVRKWLACGLVHDIQLAPQGVDLQTEASERDLRINAMYCDPLTSLVHDPFGGLEDLKTRRFRIVGPSFSSDPVRKLRLVRSCIAFDAEAEEEAWARSQSMPLEAVARERVFEEVRAILCSAWPLRRLLELWARIGLANDWPELQPLLHSEQASKFGLGLNQLARALPAISDGLLDLLCYFASRIDSPPDRHRWLLRILDDSRAATVMEFVGIDEQLGRLSEFLALHPQSSFHTDLELVATFRKRGSLAALAARAEARAGERGQHSALATRVRDLTLDGQKIDAWITGRELRCLGLQPGPQFGPLLDRAVTHQLRGDFKDRADAARWLHAQHQEGENPSC